MEHGSEANLFSTPFQKLHSRNIGKQENATSPQKRGPGPTELTPSLYMYIYSCILQKRMSCCGRRKEGQKETTPPPSYALVPLSEETATEPGAEKAAAAAADPYAPPDGGWGWVVVIASFLCNLVGTRWGFLSGTICFSKLFILKAWGLFLSFSYWPFF